MEWHLVITKEMRALGLQGNDLLVYATINGFSQNGQGCYWGNLDYLAQVCGISRRTAAYCLKRLCEGGFIVKDESIIRGVRYTSYAIKPDALGGSANLAPVVQNFPEGSANLAPNNISNNIVGDINISSLSYKKGGFVKPSFFEVQQYIAQRGSAVDAEAFYAYYESNGWKVGRNPMRDWKQAVITWERREQRPTPTPPRKESWAERQRRNLEKISAMYAGEGDVQ